MRFLDRYTTNYGRVHLDEEVDMLFYDEFIGHFFLFFHHLLVPLCRTFVLCTRCVVFEWADT